MRQQNMKHLLICWILAGIGFALPVAGQHPFFYRLDEADGLPAMEAYFMHQDSRGYLWLGTAAGLCRYDGYECVPYPAPHARNRGANLILEDPQGRIWFSNFAGQLFYVRNDSVHLLQAWERIPHAYFFPYSIAADGSLWVSNGLPDAKLYHFSTDLRQVEQADLPSRRAAGQFDGLHISGRMTVAARPLTIGRRKLLLPDPRNAQPVAGQEITVYWVKGRLYCLQPGDENRLWKLSENGQTMAPVSDRKLDNNLKINSINEDAKGNIWALTSAGAFNMSRAADHPLFPGIALGSMIQDREGNYWFSTLNQGFLVLPSLDNLCYTAENSPIGSDGVVRLATDSRGNLYAATNAGDITRIAPDGGTLAYRLPRKAPIEALFVDEPGGRLLVSQQELHAFDLHTARPLSPFKVLNTKSVSPIAPGLFALGTSVFGLSLFTEKPPQQLKSSFPVAWQSLPDSGWKLLGKAWVQMISPRKSPVTLWEPTHQELWVSDLVGLHRWQGLRASPVVLPGDTAPVIAQSMIRLPDGTIWVASLMNGLLAFRDGKLAETLLPAQGLLSLNLTCMAADADGLWLGFGEGVQRYDLASRTFTTYARANGLISREVLAIALTPGWVWVATARGLQRLPRHATIATREVPLQLAGLWVADQPRALSPGLHLSASENNVRFGFRALSFSNKRAIGYRYRLLGLDSAWVVTPGDQNEARFPALPPGSYTFEVQALGSGNLPISAVERFAFRLMPPWWQRWWFLLSVAVAAGGLAYGYYRYSLRQAARANQMQLLQSELRLSRLSSLKAQMNPHFIFNALNSIQTFMLTNEKLKANQYLGKFSDLMRSILEMSNEARVTLAAEHHALQLYLELEAIRFGDGFSFELWLHPDLDDEEIMLPSMLVQPYVENSLKHGLMHQTGEKWVNVRFEPVQNGAFLQITVEDNGVGRAKADEIQRMRAGRHKSFASQATQKRLELLMHEHQDRLTVTYTDKTHPDGSAAGTLVRLLIPV